MMLEVQNLSVEYENQRQVVKAINNISFKLSKNEILGITGESGSGKSTLAMVLLKLFNSKISIEGKILFNSLKGLIDIAKINTTELNRIRGKEIAIIFQDPASSLNPLMRCGEQIAEMIKLHNLSKHNAIKPQVIDLLSRVEFDDPLKIFNAYPFELSGGQQQRVMIAMAISCNPQLLIADEPTSFLDGVSQSSIMNMLKKIQVESTMSMILITHQLEMLASVADRIMVMQNGCIIETGGYDSVAKSFSNNYTRKLFTNNVESINSEDRNNTNICENNKENRGTVLKVDALCTNYTMNKNLLQIKSTYVNALNHVSFEIERGEVLGVTGVSGCGKTTLARTITRLTEPSSGRIIFNDQDILEADNAGLREVRKKIQIVFQHSATALNPKLKIGDAIVEPMLVHQLCSKSEAKQKAIELLIEIGLGEQFYNRFPYQLSGGQQQRVAVVRALALKPELIIFDEILSALDISSQVAILKWLNDLKHKSELTFIFISHNIALIKNATDRVLVMNQGRIEEHGVTEHVFSNPQSEYTRKLIEAGSYSLLS